MVLRPATAEVRLVKYVIVHGYVAFLGVVDCQDGAIHGPRISSLGC